MTDKIKLLIFPFNGNAIEALDCIDANVYDVDGFIDDDVTKQGQHHFGFHVYDRTILDKNYNSKILAVPGSPLTYLNRSKIIASLNVQRERFTTIIHPSAKISKQAKIGFNCLIMAGTVVTSNAIIGNHVCILPNSVIHHDSIIGNYTLIGSNVTIAGDTIIGDNCYLGSGSSIINNINVGNNSLIGMGTNVIKNIPKNSKVVGNPGRLI